MVRCAHARVLLQKQDPPLLGYKCRCGEVLSTPLAEAKPSGIKNFPEGWKIIESRLCDCLGEAFILCKKDDERDHDTEYVVWEADLVNGGCYHGFYTEDLVEGQRNLKERFERHG